MAMGHVRSSTPACVPAPVVKKKNASTGGIAPSSTTESSARRSSALHSKNPAQRRDR